jgi:biopolymer transport protein ExbB
MFAASPASRVLVPVVPNRPRATKRLNNLLVLLAVMMLTLLFTASHSFAQAGAPAKEAPSPQKGTITLVLENWKDPVFWVIMILSVIGLTLIIQGFIKNRAEVLMPEETTNQIREMISQKKLKELLEFTETDDNFISKALNPALKRAPSFSSMKEAMETAIGEQTADAFRKIEYLNIIGNLGPLLGLMGTVLGMIDAFSAMQAAHGDTNPAQLAGGISRALTHTFLGLFLALPCLAAFGILRTMVDRLTVRGALIAEELLLMIKPAEAAKPAAGAVAGAVRTAATPQPAVRKAPAVPTPAPAPVG